MTSPIQMRFVVDGERNDGIDLLEQLISTGDADLTSVGPEVQHDAMRALEQLKFGYLIRELLEGGEHLAQQVHSDTTRGLLEVIQNADDQGATELRFAFRQTGRASELWFAHNGSPVELRDVLNMTLPLLSGSRADPEKIGRFGVGLKTLNQFGSRLQVHCAPLPSFEVSGGRIKLIQRPRSKRDFWNAEARETLFVLQLESSDFDERFFRDWASSLDSSSLIFLRSLRSVSLHSFSKRRLLESIEVRSGKAAEVDLGFPRATEQLVRVVSAGSGRRKWHVYSVRYPVPKRLSATNKTLDSTVRIQVAVPTSAEAGRVYVGLPLREESTLPFSFNAPFEPNVDRTALRSNNELNAWLIARVIELSAYSAVHLFSAFPKVAWNAYALPGETAGGTDWLTNEFNRAVVAQRKRIATQARIANRTSELLPFSDFVIEPDHFEGRLEPDIVESAWRAVSSDNESKHFLPNRVRDKSRWRDVMDAVSSVAHLSASDALAVVGWSDSERSLASDKWLVGIAAAGIRSGLGEQLFETGFLRLTDFGTERFSPNDLKGRGEILVLRSNGKTLAHDLGLTRSLPQAFRSRDADAVLVRDWLESEGVLARVAADSDALSALAHVGLDSPVDLSRRERVLRRLRDALMQVPLDERQELGRRVGQNILLSGFEFAAGKRVRVAVRPAEAYVPRAIEKEGESWEAAAEKTEGLKWIDARYGEILRSNLRGQGALVSLRALGALTAPRLERVQGGSSSYARNRVLTPLQRDELRGLPRWDRVERDWNSPDLEAVLESITSTKQVRARSRRARALFQVLHRTWDASFADCEQAEVVRDYYGVKLVGRITATWLAQLASAEWLSTSADKFSPAAPRDLTILTPATFEIEGADERKYVNASEIPSVFVDSPTVRALQIQGRVSASSIVARLEDLREAESSGRHVEARAAERCYAALSTYCPGGEFESESDLEPAEIRKLFARGPSRTGLLRIDGKWLRPNQARLGALMPNGIEQQDGAARTLWSLLEIKEPSTRDCVDLLVALSVDQRRDVDREAAAFRRLIEIHESKAIPRRELLRVPFRTFRGVKRSTKNIRIYACGDSNLAAAVGSKWNVWDAPLPLVELRPMVNALGLELLGAADSSLILPARGLGNADDLLAHYRMTLAGTESYLNSNHRSIAGRLGAANWDRLRDAVLVSGSGWNVKVKNSHGKSVEVEVPSFFRSDPPTLAIGHEDELGNTDSVGRVIALELAGQDAAAETLSTIALAWGYGYQHRDKYGESLANEMATTSNISEPELSFEAFSKGARRSAATGPRGNRRRQRRASAPAAAPRELVDVDEIDIDSVALTVLESGSKGSIQIPKRVALRSPTSRDSRGGIAAKRSPKREYTDADREDAAFELLARKLETDYGFNLEDIRSDRLAGADGLDREADIWVELKAHARDLSDTVRLEPAEAKRAEEKRGKYLLALVWDLEQPRTPQIMIVSDPFKRLDLYLQQGMRFTGLTKLIDDSKSKA